MNDDEPFDYQKNTVNLLNAFKQAEPFLQMLSSQGGTNDDIENVFNFIVFLLFLVIFSY